MANKNTLSFVRFEYADTLAESCLKYLYLKIEKRKCLYYCQHVELCYLFRHAFPAIGGAEKAETAYFLNMKINHPVIEIRNLFKGDIAILNS